MTLDARNPRSNLSQGQERQRRRRHTYKGSLAAREHKRRVNRLRKSQLSEEWSAQFDLRRKRRLLRYLSLLTAPTVPQTDAIRGVLDMRPLTAPADAGPKWGPATVLRLATELRNVLPHRVTARDVVELVHRVIVRSTCGLTIADVGPLVESVFARAGHAP